MRIEAFFIEGRGGVMLTGPAVFEHGIPRFTGEMDLLSENTPRGGERGTVLAVDVKGMRKGDMDDSALRIKVRGSDLWFMTCIETGDDLLDALLFDCDMILMPYHMLASDGVLKDAYELSDSCLPAVFVLEGSALTRRGTGDIPDILEALDAVGFSAPVVVDTDGSLTPDMWVRIFDLCPGTVPYVGDVSQLPSVPAAYITDHRF